MHNRKNNSSYLRSIGSKLVIVDFPANTTPMLVRGQKYQSNQSTEMSVKSEKQTHLSEIMRKVIRQGQKTPLMPSLDLGCAHVSNTTWAQGWHGLDMWTGTGSVCSSVVLEPLSSVGQLKYDLRKDRKEASARAVLSQDLFEIVEDCECHEILLALTTCCWPLIEAEGCGTVTFGPIWCGGLFLPVFLAALLA